jgi:hypothetical protein
MLAFNSAPHLIQAQVIFKKFLHIALECLHKLLMDEQQVTSKTIALQQATECRQRGWRVQG